MNSRGAIVKHTEPSQPHTRGGHAFNTARPCPDCWQTVFHYSCIDCGVECTAGTKHGPSHSDSRRQYRCHECHLEDAKRISALNEAAPELVEALEPLEASATLITKLLTKVQDEELCDAIANLEEDIAEARKALAKARGGK